MKVFISWLIANLEVAVCSLLAIVFGLLTQFGLTSIEPGERIGFTLIVIGAAAFPGGLTGRNFMGGFIIFLLCIAGYIYGWYSIESGLLESDGITYMRYILGSGIIAFILAVTVGIYTASNMDDVVSYRMLYQNSNVEMFDMTLLYTLNRFMAAFVYFSWTSVFSISYLFLKSNI